MTSPVLRAIRAAEAIRGLKRFLAIVFLTAFSFSAFNYCPDAYFSMPPDVEFSGGSNANDRASEFCSRRSSGGQSSSLSIINFNSDVNMTILANNLKEAGVKSGGDYSPPTCKARQRIAILVPFRNRTEHLGRYLAHIHPFLQRQGASYRIFVIEQVDKNLFSRGLLLNIGVRIALTAFSDSPNSPNFDCLIFHDVDVLPENDLNIYYCDDKSIRHLAPAIDENRYHTMYYRQVSTVVSILAENFKKLNGFSNLYWGWGQEDDDFTCRALDVGLKISRPPYRIGRYKMMRHVKSWHENSMTFNLFMSWKARYSYEGFNSLDRDIKFKVLSVTNEPLYTNVSVDLGPMPLAVMELTSKLPQMSVLSLLSFYFP